MEKVIFSFVFNRKKQLNVEGKALIQIEACSNKKKKYFSTRVYLKPNQWDDKRKLVKNHPNGDVLNKYLMNYMIRLEREELEALLCGKDFSVSDTVSSSSSNILSFTVFMREEIGRGNLKKSTMKNHLSTLKLLAEYKKNILFNELTFTFLCEFENYLLTQKYHRNTIAKHMKHLKRYINLAINKDLYDLQSYPFRRYKIKYQESSRSHLTPEELDILENLELPSLAQRRCLDMFLFSCYTGLRFSDITSIKKENFQWIDEKIWLIYSSVKTGVNVRLPLSLLFEGKSIPIFNRYKENVDDTLFNVSVTINSNINKLLRRICRYATIEKHVTFHVARHTNATLLLYSGANITTVQKLLGHKSVRTTEIYSKIMDMTVIRDLEKIASV